MEKLLTQRQALRDETKKRPIQLEADGRQHDHPIEAEVWRMKVGTTNRFDYKAQAVAEAQEDVIVACDAVRQEIDGAHLVLRIGQARTNVAMAAPPLPTPGGAPVADLQAAAHAGLPVLAPPAAGKPAKDSPHAAQPLT